MSRKPFNADKLIKKLKKEYGIIAFESKGKGSERILVKPVERGSSKGPQIPIKYHGKSTELSVPVILSILRRFDIDPDEFWD